MVKERQTGVKPEDFATVIKPFLAKGTIVAVTGPDATILHAFHARVAKTPSQWVDFSSRIKRSPEGRYLATASDLSESEKKATFFVFRSDNSVKLMEELIAQRQAVLGTGKVPIVVIALVTPITLMAAKAESPDTGGEPKLKASAKTLESANKFVELFVKILNKELNVPVSLIQVDWVNQSKTSSAKDATAGKVGKGGKS